MSFELYIDGKPTGQVASMGGMQDLTDAYASLDSELGRFLELGYSEKPTRLKQAVRELIDTDENMAESNRKTLQGLIRRLPEKGTVSLSSD